MSDEIYRYTREDVQNLRERVAILQALSDALDLWPDVSQMAFESASPQHLVERLAALLGVPEDIASSVCDMQVSRVTTEERLRLRLTLDECTAELRRAVARLDD